MAGQGLLRRRQVAIMVNLEAFLIMIMCLQKLKPAFNAVIFVL